MSVPSAVDGMLKRPLAHPMQTGQQEKESFRRSRFIETDGRQRSSMTDKVMGLRSFCKCILHEPSIVIGKIYFRSPVKFFPDEVIIAHPD